LTKLAGTPTSKPWTTSDDIIRDSAARIAVLIPCHNEETSEGYSCRKRQSEDLVKNGTNASGSSQYHCKACGAWGVLAPKERATGDMPGIERWLWSAMNRETREIVASDCSERRENTSRILWDRVPSS